MKAKSDQTFSDPRSTDQWKEIVTTIHIAIATIDGLLVGTVAIGKTLSGIETIVKPLATLRWRIVFDKLIDSYNLSISFTCNNNTKYLKQN